MSGTFRVFLDRECSENYDWKVWSCKKGKDSRLFYRWYCYIKGALYAIKNRKKYDAIFFWQQMAGYTLFEIINIIPFKMPDIVFYTFFNYHTNGISGKFKKHMVRSAFRHSKGLIWPSEKMSDDVNKDFPEFAYKNHFALNPIMDVIETNVPVAKELDDPKFRNGVYTAGKSERDFNIVIRAFRNTDIPVTIVCADDYAITETDISSNIRVLRFAQVDHIQYYALAEQAFCILISTIDEKSPCGQIIVAYAMENSIPLIATDCYGVKDYVVHNENGVLFKVEQADEILKAYRKLRTDEAFRNKLIANALVTAKELGPGPYVKKIISIIEN